jgi:mono/diheme cytochrome c family protein
VNTRLLVTGCVSIMCVALVSGQSGPAAQAPKAVAKRVAVRTQAPAPRAARAVKAPAAAPDVTKQRALVDQYCVPCHNAKLKTANLLLDQLDLAHLGAHAELGEKIVRKLRAGMMPPTGMPRPDPETREAFISWMEGELDRAAVTNLPPPGLHRLNRTEYANAIRDLLGLDVDATKFLPSDDSTHGFDNMAGTLTMSPALVEAYLSAAGKISRLAIGDVSAPTQTVYEAPSDTAQTGHVEGLPFGTRGGMIVKHEFPADAEYIIKVQGIAGYFKNLIGQIKGERLEVTVDGERVKLFDWDKEIGTGGAGKIGATPRIPIKAGLHTVGVAFLATNDAPGSELNRPFVRTLNSPGDIPGYLIYPGVGQVQIEGPYDAQGARDTLSRRKIFVCQPTSAQNEEACARTIISTLAKKAYRRPPAASDIGTLMEFYQAGRNDGSFDSGIESALQRMLADPEFVYRGEPESAALVPGKTYRIGDLELASRLSFFLWSTIPDDQLMAVAAQGKLKDPAVLEQQVRRMIADPRSAALVENFTGQWLNVRGMAAVEPVVNLFPDFDSNLRDAFRTETELFFDSIVHEDHSVLDLLTADYTFVNERLAKHYGIPNIYGSQFRRVTLGPDMDMRRGLLGKGALLTVTSQAARTSPVARGKWFLQTFLGVSPPDPPPNVPAIKPAEQDAAGNAKVLTMRETMEAHHTNPVCATCHRIFEPIGLSLENFDAVGAWRTQDSGTPIDATGTLVDGTKLDGVASLRGVLIRYQDQFVRVVTEKLLTYALGRGVEYQDMPLVRSIVRDAAPSQYRFSSIVLAIVKSAPFQMNMKVADVAQERAAR